VDRAPAAGRGRGAVAGGAGAPHPALDRPSWRLSRGPHEVGRILAAQGYDQAIIGRVQDIVRKRNLAKDADVQALEDALCLVFVETQFRELADRLDEEKMVDVVRKTLAKMSDQGKAFALAMDLPDPDRRLLELAL
jgi:hypothetical protein